MWYLALVIARKFATLSQVTFNKNSENGQGRQSPPCAWRGRMPFLFHNLNPTCTIRDQCTIVRRANAQGCIGPAKSYRLGTDRNRAPTEEEVAAAIFRKAAEEILRRAPNTSASAFADDLPIAGRIPLPRKRPIGRSGSQAPSAPPALGSNAQ